MKKEAARGRRCVDAVGNAGEVNLDPLQLAHEPDELAPNVDRRDYDPTVQGCIGIRHFLWIFHLWLIDVYCQTPRGARKLTPAQRWREGTRVWAPDFIAQAKDLDVIFGTVRTATLDHRGVVYETLRYYSEELHGFRLRNGHHRQVRVKINPADLTAVHVWDAKAQAWIRAVATDLSYATGLSLHRHTLNKRYAAEQFGNAEIEALLAAEEHLRDTITQALPMALSIRANANIARAVGIGTQHIFGNLDADGRLGPLSGPFAGQALNPFRDVPRPRDRPLSREQAQRRRARIRPSVREKVLDGVRLCPPAEAVAACPNLPAAILPRGAIVGVECGREVSERMGYRGVRGSGSLKATAAANPVLDEPSAQLVVSPENCEAASGPGRRLVNQSGHSLWEFFSLERGHNRKTITYVRTAFSLGGLIAARAFSFPSGLPISDCFLSAERSFYGRSGAFLSWGRPCGLGVTLRVIARR